MVTGSKMNEVLAKCKDATSQAVEKAAEMTGSASSGISTAMNDMREKSGPNPGTGLKKTSGSTDGDLCAPEEAGEYLLPAELSLSEISNEAYDEKADDTGEDTISQTTDDLINSYGRNIIDCFKSGIKDKNILTIAGVMGIIWIIIGLLPAIGINPLPVQFLSFLTFAQGGLTGGGLGFIGGIAGKGLIAYFVALVIAGKITPDNTISSLRSFAAGFSGKKWDVASVSPLLIGVGSALLIYNFLAGTSTVFNCMVGIVAFIVAVRSLSGRTGFVRNIFSSLFAKEGRVNSGFVTKIMVGWAAGFALGVLLSLPGSILWGYVCYIAGLIILIAGAVLVYSSGKKEGAAA